MSIMFCRLLITFAWTFVLIASIEAVPQSKNCFDGCPNTMPNYKTGLRTAQWTEEMNVNPDELGDYFEGDIMVANSIKRNELIDDGLWPNGVIPIVISGDFNNKEGKRIHEAMNEFRKYTCMNFTYWDNEENYVNVTSDITGCWSEIGKKGGEQKLNLQIPECLRKGIIIHQFMHTAGFYHEHTRSNRDNYVKINWENIQEDAKKKFEKVESVITNFDNSNDFPYDYDSIMHSSAYMNAKDNQIRTIIPIKDSNAKIGQRKHLSDLDIMKINTMYNCSSQYHHENHTHDD